MSPSRRSCRWTSSPADKRPPSKHLEDVIGQPVTNLLINRGGLYGKLIRGGVIRLGGAIEPL